MARMNIVFIASEAAPLAKTGGLADVAGALPMALSRLGHKVSVILPYYRKQVGASGVRVHPLDESVTIWVDGVNRIAPLHIVSLDGVDFILVEQDDMFDRDGIYGPAGGAWEDNFPRFLFFSRAALEASCLLDKPVDIIHCHDWQTGFIPLLLKTQYQHQPRIASAKTVFTIHNLAYQGCFPSYWLHRLGLPADYYHTGCYEFYSQINCMKAGIVEADHITTVSKTYAEEILTPEYGCNLQGILGEHAGKLSGIVNGLDIENWDPATDSAIAANFTAGKMQGKAACRASLQEAAGLATGTDAPLLTMISRLAEQKGVDLLLDCIPQWLQDGYQLAILGSGDPAWEAMLHRLAAERPEQMYFFSGFDETLARKIYAGGDIFLMPSRFEPCGLGQLMAMRYGNIPVVRATGGLKDTVTDYAQDKPNATGFAFEEANPAAFRAAVSAAVEVWRKPASWKRIVSNAVRRDSSWDASASTYLELYTSLKD
ncbi:MAG: glycogen synthase GlgA [Zetaproteobacteria bacterium CG12_big_fil_rev_8_21_14_0_65_55_1124]|nr:MAG: glycogen synthase GlgA [Zetaproteobacteria bacterium CG08_land_8_20_14_0_20_55_17]PIW42126.1 MAG: glycogen synthase GlgA [Zetaproteobacteria bacterium CG12_big_fil_rev_8_21_14_0_65_55_1124]PIY52411.1 MAG: glycogen synthase GlgA [Zetaproteobacteria bacterium CG_4_10_14_0_8_um_filter_55_43]PIZ37329.1 MAG: glycogen synthase GlgA [Zetaproteobacteria bacterium CG_4_10_14_0_2_um_filter_55_20]PJB82310.1 MAG: glycogen synthase GlgA [Zetaproteobacteria bacterium CG_4_9_14_0_8_um_filter_55_31]